MHIDALQEEIRQLQRLLLVQDYLVKTDPLTGLSNRRAIEETILAELQRRDRYDGPLALFLIDVDRFKDINDTHSHVAGDHALREVARALTKASRQGVDRAGGHGGDEFLVIAPQTDADGAVALAERIQEELGRADIRFGGQAIRLTVSLGVAVAEPGVATCYAELLHLAATALGEAKKNGRNRFVIRRVETSLREG
jgi:diguanylate cyclase (GGDEF)-like protein